MREEATCKVDGIAGIRYGQKQLAVLTACVQGSVRLILLLHDTKLIKGVFVDMLPWSSAVLIRCPQNHCQLETMVVAAKSQCPYAVGMKCSDNWSV